MGPRARTLWHSLRQSTRRRQHNGCHSHYLGYHRLYRLVPCPPRPLPHDHTFRPYPALCPSTALRSATGLYPVPPLPLPCIWSNQSTREVKSNRELEYNVRMKQSRNKRKKNVPFPSYTVWFTATNTPGKLEYNIRMRQNRTKTKETTYLFLPPLFDCCVCKQRIVVSLTHAKG